MLSEKRKQTRTHLTIASRILQETLPSQKADQEKAIRQKSAEISSPSVGLSEPQNIAKKHASRGGVPERGKRKGRNIP